MRDVPIGPPAGAPKRILVVHSTELNTRETVLNHLRCYREHLQDTEVIYHHYRMPHRGLQDLDFDLIILNYCFLSKRNIPEFRPILEKYGFLAEMDCPVVALPQDDFSCCALLDEWLFRWRVHTIFTPRSDGVELLYPHASRSSNVDRVLPGYVKEQLALDLASRVKPLADREIDLGTRVRLHSYQHGWFGRLKGADSVRLAEEAKKVGFQIDVSTDNRDVLLGKDWFDFLANCRFTVARRGGSSLIDPYGLIKAKILAYTQEHPGASFEEVEEACFPGEDLSKPLSALTPRVLDAALTRTCLILPEEDYERLLHPWEHYIPLPEDKADYGSVFEAMRDHAQAERMIEATYETLIASGKFSYESFVRQVTRVATTGSERGGDDLNSEYWVRRRLLEGLPRKTSQDLFVAFQRIVLSRSQMSRLGPLRQALSCDADEHHFFAKNASLSRIEAEIITQVREHSAEENAIALLDDVEGGHLEQWSLYPWYFEALSP